MGLVDFTNPGAWTWYQSKLKKLLTRRGLLQDRLRRAHPVRDIAWFDGSDPVRMHNYYTLLYNRCVFSLLERERGEGEAVLFARSSSAGGAADAGALGRRQLRHLQFDGRHAARRLSLAASGFGFWSHDISGFEDTAPADVYKRWCAFGLLSSHSRLHGSAATGCPGCLTRRRWTSCASSPASSAA
jgi:alpha-D-xyloside xylohydrolase